MPRPPAGQAFQPDSVPSSASNAYPQAGTPDLRRVTAAFLTVAAVGIVIAGVVRAGKQPGAPDGSSGPDDTGRETRATAEEQPATHAAAWLGVFTSRPPAALAAQLSELLTDEQGLLITHVLPESPAEAAGLRRYDVLATYDGRKLLTAEQLRRLLAADGLTSTSMSSVARTSPCTPNA
jgi:membrane-associated protease RseP (regulator of RpoE activity)